MTTPVFNNSVVRALLFALFLAFLTVSGPAARGHTFETIFAENVGSSPYDTLVKGRDGNFYGTTEAGGASSFGTVFKVTPTGVLTTLASFDGATGLNPRAGLVLGSDGNFYGTTKFGGASDKGAVFKVTPAGELTRLASFNGNNGSYPSAGLVEGRDGNFYGTTEEGGASVYGTIFRVTPAGELTTLVSFNSVNGSKPSAGLVEGSDGSFYGTTDSGGASLLGTVFKVTPSGELSTLVSFDGTNGSSPRARLIRGKDGNFYGTTYGGGASRYGTVFRVTPEGVLTLLVSFDTANGSAPHAGLVAGSDGNFYGTTTGDAGGATYDGTIFRVTPAGEFTTLVTFNSTDCKNPCAGLLEGDDGNFYGTTVDGAMGSSVFKVTPAGVFSKLVSFNSPHGSYPYEGLLEGGNGNFYGTTNDGGPRGAGTIYSVTPSGELTTLVSFDGTNGGYPRAGLVKGSDGSFYGTTVTGGASNNGTIYTVTPSGELTTLVSFSGANGRYPYAGLVKGSDGNFYGTTREGGTVGSGTVFKVTPAGELTTLVSFNFTNGSYPQARLVKGSDGNFYGTTYNGGAGGRGTIFKVTPVGQLTTLVSFNSANGGRPTAPLVIGSDGNFYGTTSEGGARNVGTVFKVTPDGKLTSLISFNVIDGMNPTGGLVEGGDGNFYGTTSAGGASGATGAGTIFRITPTGELTTLYSFDRIVAAYPTCTPVFGRDGKLYGTSSQMAVWRLSLSPAVKITPPTNLTTTSTMLGGTVNAYSADTTVAIEYGLTTAYGSSIVANPATVTGDLTTAVSATLSGLAPHTTYYYRLNASNSNGTSSTPGATFTTANTLPVAVNDSFPPDPNIENTPLLVLENDSDDDGDRLTITSVTQGTYGTVAIFPGGGKLDYIPGPGFAGRDSFSYTISDGFATATAQVEIRATVPFTRGLLFQDSEVPGAGQEGSGIPVGARFKGFGVPAINSAGDLAFTATYGTPGKNVAELSIFSFESKAAKSMLAARRGQTAPGTDGALFSSFKDPLINDAGEIAFLATLSGGDTTKKNKDGIWISSASESSGLETALVARTGAQPPGVSAGAQWQRFTSIALSSSPVGIDSAAPGAARGGWSLAFTAFMATGPGGVKAGDDMGLWIATPEETVLALREGQKLEVGGTEKRLRTFAALKTLPATPGQGNGVSTTGRVVVQAFFTDATQALLRVSRSENEAETAERISIEALALPKDPITGTDETAAKFGIPAQSSSGSATAWLGTVSGKANPAAVFERNVSTPEILRIIARKGDGNTGIEGTAFQGFSSVAVNDSASALILGTITGDRKRVSTSSDGAIWWRRVNGDTLSLQLLAREGAQPPGTAPGTQWSVFTSLGLPEGSYGPMFTARLTGSKELARPERITKDNDAGLWAMDSSGALQLIVREGQEVPVKGSPRPWIVKSFTVLSAVPGSPAQRHSFNSDGRIVYHALFTDGSQAIIAVQLP